MLSRDQILRILDLHELPAPDHWIARELGVPVEDVRATIRLVGGLKKYTLSADRYDQLRRAVEDEMPLTEIRKTYNIFPSTVRTYYPNYREAEAHDEVRDITARGGRFLSDRG